MKKSIYGLVFLVIATCGITACGEKKFSLLKDDQAKANFLGNVLTECENAQNEDIMSSYIYDYSSYNDFEKNLFKKFKSNAEITNALKSSGVKYSRKYWDLKKYDDNTYVIASRTELTFNGNVNRGNIVYHYFVVNGDDVKYDLVNSYLYQDEILETVNHEHKEEPAVEVSFEENSKSFYGIAFGSSPEQVKYLMRTKGWTGFPNNTLANIVSGHLKGQTIRASKAPDVKVIDFTGGKYIDEDDFTFSFFFYRNSLFRVSFLKQSSGKYNDFTESYKYTGAKGGDVIKALKEKYNLQSNNKNKDGLDCEAVSVNRRESNTISFYKENNYDRYIAYQKLETAKNMLKNSDYTCSEIALILAYPSQSYFTECFRKELGVTPKKYRMM